MYSKYVELISINNTMQPIVQKWALKRDQIASGSSSCQTWDLGDVLSLPQFPSPQNEDNALLWYSKKIFALCPQSYHRAL